MIALDVRLAKLAVGSGMFVACQLLTGVGALPLGCHENGSLFLVHIGILTLVEYYREIGFYGWENQSSKINLVVLAVETAEVNSDPVTWTIVWLTGNKRILQGQGLGARGVGLDK